MATIAPGINVLVANQDTEELADLSAFGDSNIVEIYGWKNKILTRYAPGMGDYNSLKFLVKNTGYLINIKQEADLPFFSPQDLQALADSAAINQYNSVYNTKVDAGTGSFTLPYAALEKGLLYINGKGPQEHTLEGNMYGNFEPTDSQTPKDEIKYFYNREL